MSYRKSIIFSFQIPLKHFRRFLRSFINDLVFKLGTLLMWNEKFCTFDFRWQRDVEFCKFIWNRKIFILNYVSRKHFFKLKESADVPQENVNDWIKNLPGMMNQTTSLILMKMVLFLNVCLKKPIHPRTTNV